MSNFHSFNDFRNAPSGGAPQSGVVIPIENDEHFLRVVNACADTGKLTVLDMNATWCGPCRMMKPQLEKLASEFKDVFFLDVDVEKCREAARNAQVSSIPAFLFFKGKQQVDQLVGANPGKLRAIIEQNCTPLGPAAAPAMPSGGQRLGEGEPAIVPDPTMLNSLVEMGFTEEQSKAALIAVKNRELSQALDWITEHPDLPMSQPPPVQQAPQQQPSAQQQFSPEAMAAFLAAAASASGISQQPGQAPATAPTTTAAPVVHDALCNYCQKQIVGVRYKCTVCPDFDMCEECKNKGIHDPTHAMTAITENIRPKMTAAEVELKKQELKRKLEAKRAEEEEAERQRKKAQELERRRAGKDLQEAKERFEQSQARKADIARKKEAQEAIAAKERVRRLIEQDKIERHARLAGEDPEAAAAAARGLQHPKQHIHVPMEQKPTIPIQIRLPDGKYIKNEFPKSSTLWDVHQWVSKNRTDPIPPEMTSFVLIMAAPRRVYTQADMRLTLEQADLAPSASLILANRRS